MIRALPGFFMRRAHALHDPPVQPQAMVTETVRPLSKHITCRHFSPRHSSGGPAPTKVLPPMIAGRSFVVSCPSVQESAARLNAAAVPRAKSSRRSRLTNCRCVAKTSRNREREAVAGCNGNSMARWLRLMAPLAENGRPRPGRRCICRSLLKRRRWCV
jgi:hypothetical protein